MNKHKFWNSASLNSALEGKSIIDSERLNFKGIESVNNFLSCYGYDWNDCDDRIEIELLRQEALSLISEELLTDSEEIPSDISQQTDIRDLMLELSNGDDEKKKPWICALLRVMHTLSHSYSYFNDRYQREIHEQILNRFTPHIEIGNGDTFFGDIKLAGFESRSEKSRRSVAMKLLHKTENVAADIFDWVGIRFITHCKIDILRILSFLRRKNVVMFANIKPSRSRNTLLDLAKIEEKSKEGMDFEQLKYYVEENEFSAENVSQSYNPFSESSYRSVQFTCRQRIKVKEPNNGRICFFFPYEIQLIDRKNYEKAIFGMASHEEYKRRQRHSIRRRILPHLRSLD